MSTKNWVESYIESTKEKWTTTSDYIWDNPEIRFEEFESSRYLSDLLKQEGFTVEKGTANIETAFIAEYGSGGPVIAFLGEYDALSELSQEAGELTEKPITKGGNGHGCGHNLLGTGALAAAVTLKEYMKENNLEATVRFYGCPAEEGGSGKTFMARAGAFDDVDVALTWHPAPITGIWSFGTLANVQAYFKFKGKSAHAAGAPHLGRSALDAVELMNTGVNYLREHIIDDARVHYAITETGGTSPNVVQANAEVVQLIRAPKVDQAMEIYERVKKIAEGAALMTETEVEVIFDKACSDYIPNDTLSEVMGEAMQEIGAPSFTDEEFAFAKQVQGTLSAADLAAANQGVKQLDVFLQKPLSDIAIPYFKVNKTIPGSTDVGDVSWVAPTAQCGVTTCTVGTPFHTWQLVAQGKTSYAHKGMLQVAKILALTALKALENQDIIKKAKAEHEENVGPNGYQCPIPNHIQPNNALQSK